MTAHDDTHWRSNSISPPSERRGSINRNHWQPDHTSPPPLFSSSSSLHEYKMINESWNQAHPMMPKKWKNPPSGTKIGTWLLKISTKSLVKALMTDGLDTWARLSLWPMDTRHSRQWKWRTFSTHSNTDRITLLFKIMCRVGMAWAKLTECFKNRYHSGTPPARSRQQFKSLKINDFHKNKKWILGILEACEEYWISLELDTRRWSQKSCSLHNALVFCRMKIFGSTYTVEKGIWDDYPEFSEALSDFLYKHKAHFLGK